MKPSFSGMILGNFEGFIDWYLTSNLAVFQLFPGMNKRGLIRGPTSWEIK
jgi:O-glycosyl hydrolase